MKVLLAVLLFIIPFSVNAERCEYVANGKMQTATCAKKGLRLIDKEICCRAVKKCESSSKTMIYASVDTVFAGCNAKMAQNSDVRGRVKYLK